MINVSSLTKEFDNRGIAGLHGLTFNMDAGEVMAVMGPNGSGKTTLLNILSQSIKPDSGTFSVDGEVSLFPKKETISNSNVQGFLVRSITLDIEEEKKIQLARDLADTFEFTFQLRQNLDDLSSGQKQKVLLAKELINRPTLLMMDEPFTHLDPYTRKDILQGLFDYVRQQKITVLWVTHDLEEAFRFSNRVGLLNFGKFEMLSTPEEMLQRPKNLFVAKFVGFRNFFPIKLEAKGWVTPWGEVKLPAIDGAEGILIIPDFAWTEETAGLSFKITSRHVGKQVMEYTLGHGDRTVYLTRGPQHELLNPGEEISLTPRFEECLNIPL